mgnify:CR=1 FL=1
MSLLEITNLSKKFGGFSALSNIDLKVEQGTVHGIIGPNGSGKSTLFNMISGVYPPEPGAKIVFDGQEITNLPAHEIARRGVARTFQMLRIFEGMSVIDNMMAGHHSLTGYNAAAAVLGTPRVWQEERRVKAEMMELLSFIGLADYAEVPAGEMSGGQRQRVAVARALVNRPSILLADEPTGNLDPLISWEIMELLVQINRLGVTVLVATHDSDIVTTLRRRVIGLDGGRLIRDEANATYHRVG